MKSMKNANDDMNNENVNAEEHRTVAVRYLRLIWGLLFNLFDKKDSVSFIFRHQNSPEIAFIYHVFHVFSSLHFYSVSSLLLLSLPLSVFLPFCLFHSLFPRSSTIFSLPTSARITSAFLTFIEKSFSSSLHLVFPVSKLLLPLRRFLHSLSAARTATV